jgi:hypothetical protein
MGKMKGKGRGMSLRSSGLGLHDHIEPPNS